MADQMDIVSDQQQVPQNSLDGAAQLSSPPSGAGAGTGASAAASTAAAATTASDMGIKKRPPNWDTQKHRDETSALESRLADKNFNPAQYGDPLTKVRPLQKHYLPTFPAEKMDFFNALEEEVDQLIAKRRGQTA